MSALQNCFECTYWDMFKEAATVNLQINVEEYAVTVSAFIQKCMEDVSVLKNITTRANEKPWMNMEVRALLKAKKSVFFHDPMDSRRMWQGIQSITGYKAAPTPCDNDTIFLNNLNKHFVRFEALNNTTAMKAVPKQGEQRLRLDTAEVSSSLLVYTPASDQGLINSWGLKVNAIICNQLLRRKEHYPKALLMV
ncbi:hypothetical protein KUCAC02_017091 [Chaenocephalus aceratus]|uniref:Uncharacterized protein n=1 Tax=Chaenocephalus aceratus TaxID=36190 RepID=A0ACB9W076_CHAAC|nr:hypothetical protein KUCAC02_017091 [Chaenocephalus aceratus]